MRRECIELLLPQDASTVGSRRLRELLQRQTFTAVALRVGVSHVTVRRWATELLRPSRQHRATMDRVLRIPPAEWDEPTHAPRAAP